MKTLNEQIHDLAEQFYHERGANLKLTPQLIELAMVQAATLAYRIARKQANEDRRKSNLPN